MVCFASFVPHTPLLIPEVSRGNLKLLRKTVRALEKLETELYAAKPETILVISPHSISTPGVYSINLQPKLKVSFKEYGDLVTNLEFTNDTGLAYQIKEACETKIPIVLTADEKVGYSVGVPLYYLARHLSKIKLISVGSAEMERGQAVNFGNLISEQINRSGKRVAVVVSGDLSHRLTNDAPSGFSPRGQEYDQLVQKLLADKRVREFIDMDKTLISEAGECAYNSLLIFLSIIKEIHCVPEKLSYEAPFGIGYLVNNFVFNR